MGGPQKVLKNGPILLADRVTQFMLLALQMWSCVKKEPLDASASQLGERGKMAGAKGTRENLKNDIVQWPGI